MLKIPITSAAGAVPGEITPTAYARLLLDSLHLTHLSPPADDERDASQLWADSGAMWLSGHADGAARACPAPLAACAQGAWLALSTFYSKHLDPLFEAYRLLGERAAIAGFQRLGRLSPGGACQLLDTADGVVALNLPREEDRELLTAWLQQPIDAKDELADVLRIRSSVTLLQRAALLGLAVARVGPPQPLSNWYRATRYAAPQAPKCSAPLVLDLSSLWAGPLCAQLIADCGGRVIKVESTRRPDGARLGPAPFYDLLNSGKESVALDFTDPSDCKRLKSLLGHADIVIESARPRGLEQLGIHAAEFVAKNSGLVWLSITGYGRGRGCRDLIAYGDDAGVAAGLSWLMGGDQADPVFCGDAIADPLTGLHAALLAVAAWQSGGGQLLDLSLHDVVAHCINAGVVEPTPANLSEQIALPRARTAVPRATELGADSSAVLRELA